MNKSVFIETTLLYVSISKSIQIFWAAQFTESGNSISAWNVRTADSLENHGEPAQPVLRLLPESSQCLVLTRWGLRYVRMIQDVDLVSFSYTATLGDSHESGFKDVQSTCNINY